MLLGRLCSPPQALSIHDESSVCLLLLVLLSIANLSVSPSGATLVSLAACLIGMIGAFEVRISLQSLQSEARTPGLPGLLSG